MAPASGVADSDGVGAAALGVLEALGAGATDAVGVEEALSLAVADGVEEPGVDPDGAEDDGIELDCGADDGVELDCVALEGAGLAGAGLEGIELGGAELGGACSERVVGAVVFLDGVDEVADAASGEGTGVVGRANAGAAAAVTEEVAASAR